MLFQRYNQDETANHLDKEQMGQWLRPSVRLFNSTSAEEDDKTCARLVIEELTNIIKNAFEDENLHNEDIDNEFGESKSYIFPCSPSMHGHLVVVMGLLKLRAMYILFLLFHISN